MVIFDVNVGVVKVISPVVFWVEKEGKVGNWLAETAKKKKKINLN